MPQTLHPAHQFTLQTPGTLQCVGVARGSTLALEFSEGELRELQRLFEMLGLTFIVNGELFAGFEAVRGIAGEFEPECRRSVAVALAFGHEREFPCGAGPEFCWEPSIERSDTGGVGALVIAAPLQEFGEAEEIEGVFVRERLPLVEQGMDFSEEGGESPQVHLVVLHNPGERVGCAAAQVVEIELWGQRRGYVVAAMPAEAGRIDNVPC